MTCLRVFYLYPYIIAKWQPLHILLPTLDLQSLDSYCAECLDESGGEAGVGDERDVEKNVFCERKRYIDV